MHRVAASCVSITEINKLLKGPDATYVERSVDGSVVLAERGRVHEERWHEMHSIRVREVGMLSKLATPAVHDRALTKVTSLAGERGREDAPVELELVRMLSIRCDVLSQRRGIVGRGARHDTVCMCGEIATFSIIADIRERARLVPDLMSNEMNSLKPVPESEAA